MAIIKRKGAPTRKTQAAVGDVYIDTDTGLEYKCIFSICDKNEKAECEWKRTGNVVDVKETTVEPKTIVEPGPIKSSQEQPKLKYNNNSNRPPKRTNYSAQYNKKN